MNEETKTRLLEKLRQIEKKNLQYIHVVLIPDFFVDHFLYLDEFENTFTRIKNIYQQGGGNLPGVKQKIHQGGNATNTAIALAKLGIKSHLICKTNEFGLDLLNYFLGRNNVDLSGVKTNGELAITTALEFGEKHTNVMIGDPGSVAEFTFETLDEKDLEMISNSKMLCVLNWNLNKNGTELAKKAFRFAKQKNVKTFFDTGDPSPRQNEVPELITNVLTDNNLDILSLNENELIHYTNNQAHSEDEIVKSATYLKSKINARIDIHTSRFSCTISKKTTVVPTKTNLQIKRATGAGDAWNAGDIFSELLGFEDDERLLFANSIAEYYISSSNPVHPNLEETSEYISKITD